MATSEARTGTRAGAAAAVVAALLLAGCGSSAPRATSTTTAPAATTAPPASSTPTVTNPFSAPAPTTTTTVAPPPPSPATITAELVTLGDLPAGWSKLPPSTTTPSTTTPSAPPTTTTTTTPARASCSTVGQVFDSRKTAGNGFAAFKNGPAEFAENLFGYRGRGAVVVYRRLVALEARCPHPVVGGNKATIDRISFPYLAARAAAFEEDLPVTDGIYGDIHAVFVFALTGSVVVSTLYQTYGTADVSASARFTRLALAKIESISGT